MTIATVFMAKKDKDPPPPGLAAMAKRLLRSMQLASLNQTELAAASGVPQSTISRWINGQNAPRKPSDARAVAAVLKARPEELFDVTKVDEPELVSPALSPQERIARMAAQIARLSTEIEVTARQIRGDDEAPAAAEPEAPIIQLPREYPYRWIVRTDVPNRTTLAGFAAGRGRVPAISPAFYRFRDDSDNANPLLYLGEVEGDSMEPTASHGEIMVLEKFEPPLEVLTIDDDDGGGPEQLERELGRRPRLVILSIEGEDPMLKRLHIKREKGSPRDFALLVEADNAVWAAQNGFPRRIHRDERATIHAKVVSIGREWIGDAMGLPVGD